MAATAAQIARVRRMVAELTTATYSDADITSYIEAHPLTDDIGRRPLSATELALAGLTETPSTDWTPTYDLNAAAADIWEEKAGILAQDFDMDADGAKLDRSQPYEQAMKQARFYRSKRSLKSIALAPDYAPLPTSGEICEP